jgi:hypothetical protein
VGLLGNDYVLRVCIVTLPHQVSYSDLQWYCELTPHTINAHVTSEVFLRSALQSLATANVFLSSQIVFTLMMEALLSSGTLDLTGTTRRHIPEDDILQ